MVLIELLRSIHGMLFIEIQMIQIGMSLSRIDHRSHIETMGQVLVSTRVPSDDIPRFLGEGDIRRIDDSRIRHTVSHSRNDR